MALLHWLAAWALLVASAVGVRLSAEDMAESLQPAATFTKSTAPREFRIICAETNTCGSDSKGPCRNFECDEGGKFGKCFSQAKAEDICGQSDECTAVYGGGAHWWTFNAECVEVEDASFYTVHKKQQAPKEAPTQPPTGAPYVLGERGIGGAAATPGPAGGIMSDSPPPALS